MSRTPLPSSPRLGARATRVWGGLLALVLLVEAYTLATSARGDTLSEAVRAALLHPVGRFLFVPLWCWLTWHWFLAPAVTPTWRDLIVVAIGFALALLAAPRVIP